MRVGDPHLGAVDDPAVALTHRARLHHAAGVGAGIGFGLRERGGLGALDYRLEEALDLIAATLSEDVAHVRHRQGHRGVHELLQDRHLGQHRQTHSAVLLGHLQIPQAGVARDFLQAVGNLLGKHIADIGDLRQSVRLLGTGHELLLERQQFLAHDAARDIAELLDVARQTKTG